jgi:tRNA A58 N-methylase Trm61
MEEWNVLVRTMETDQENAKQFQDMAKSIFHAMVTRKIKDMRKFEQRLGSEYDKLVEDIPFPEESVRELLKDDSFFELTLKMRKTYK